MVTVFMFWFLYPVSARRGGSSGASLRTARRVVAPHGQPPRLPRYFRGMAPTAARRAKLVQRNGHQDLRGNPDACCPRRGSACDMTTRKTGGNARLVSALPVHPAAAMSSRTGGSRVGEAPRPFFSPISSGRNATRCAGMCIRTGKGGSPCAPRPTATGEAPAPQGPRQQAEAGPPAEAAMTYRQKEVEKWRKSNASSAESRP